MAIITTILNGFGASVSAPCTIIEREVHHTPSGERPYGEGWILSETDNAGYATWERYSVVGVAR